MWELLSAYRHSSILHQVLSPQWCFNYPSLLTFFQWQLNTYTFLLKALTAFQLTFFYLICDSVLHKARTSANLFWLVYFVSWNRCCLCCEQVKVVSSMFVTAIWWVNQQLLNAGIEFMLEMIKCLFWTVFAIAKAQWQISELSFRHALISPAYFFSTFFFNYLLQVNHSSYWKHLLASWSWTRNAGILWCIPT